MNDLLDSIRAQIYARLSSPLFGAFVISWVCWNHRYLFVLFSELPVQERFALAQSAVYPGDYDHWLRGFLWPLGCSIAFILVYPFPSRWLFQYWHKREVETKKLRDEIEGQTLLTKDESRKLILDSIKARESSAETIQRLNAEIEALRARPASPSREEIELENGLKAKQSPQPPVTPRDQLSEFPLDLRHGILDILRRLAVAPNYSLPTDVVMQNTKLSRVKAGYLLDKAREAKLVAHNDSEVSLSRGGRNYLVEHDQLPEDKP
jgi:hypothetical protein